MIPVAEIILSIAIFTVAILMLVVLSAIIGFLPAIVGAVVVWFLTHSLFFAALAFVVLALIWSIIKRK